MPARVGMLHRNMTLLMLNDHKLYYIERVRRRKHIQGLITVNSTKRSREMVLIYLMSMSIVPACVPGHRVPAWSLRKPEEGVGIFGTGVTGRGQLLGRCYDLSLGPLSARAEAP